MGMPSSVFVVCFFVGAKKSYNTFHREGIQLKAILDKSEERNSGSSWK